MDSMGLSSDGAAYRSRGYQLEMLEASHKGNIIVAVCFFFFGISFSSNEAFVRC